MKKRLLKDLPFGNLNKNTVLYKVNGGYQVSGGKTYYEGGSSSDNCTYVCERNEKDVIDLIWNNADWFEEANLNHIDLVLNKDSITMRFDSLDADDVEALAKGIIHLLPQLKEGNYTWNKFTNITTSIKNR